MQLRNAGLAFTLSLVCIGCGNGDEALTASTSPVILKQSKQAVVVGETLEFYGRNFVNATPETRVSTIDDELRLKFEGVFIDQAGEQTRVNLAVRPNLSINRDDPSEQTLTWRRVGPFTNPFTGDARIGRFEGTASISRTSSEGPDVSSEPAPFELDIAPSIIIEAFQPVDAQCGAPAVRALAGLAYRLRVRVVGIKATRFEYEFNRIQAKDGVTAIVHDFGKGNPIDVDEVGGVDETGKGTFGEIINFNAVPIDTQFYVTTVRVVAYDDLGNSVETALPLTVHRPIEVRYGGTFERAEVYPAEPVSSCIPGTLGGTVTYEEQVTTHRQRSVSVTVSQSWNESASNSVGQSNLEGIRVGESTSRTLGGSEWEGETSKESLGVSYSKNEANNVSVSTRDGETWSWNVQEGESNEDYESRMNSMYGEGSWKGTVGASAEGSIPGFAKATGSVETSVGVTAGGSTAGTTGNRNRTSRESNYSTGGSRDETRSFGSTVSEGQSEKLQGSYALSNARQRDFSDTEQRNESHIWNVGQDVRASESVSVGQSEAETNTWTSSESLSTGTSLSGRIPLNKYGQFYRQITRFVRRAEVRTYDLCGLATHAGELQFNEWEWAPDLAIGDTCDPAVPTRLPQAQCFIPPCDFGG
ncbi:MAG: hypothetical protein VX589_06330 [Myxococcota bacterium]|nr:hypothetical protein [Myxococcota bacterium]